MRGSWFLLVVSVAATSLAPTAAEAGAARAQVQVRPLEATVGDLLETTLTVSCPPDVELRLEPLAGELGPFSVIRGSWEAADADAEGASWVWRGALSAYRTGELELPPIVLRLDGPTGVTELRTQPVTIHIASVLPDTASAEGEAELADLKPPARVAADYGRLWRAAAGFAGLLLLAGLLWWLYRRYGERLAAVEGVDDPFQREPPHVWVYRELQLLLDRRLAEQGQLGEFYEELARIIKRYLGGRFRVDLLERTTVEVPQWLAQAGAGPDVALAARTLLESCDRVKFAGHRPEPEAWRTAVEAAYDLVDRTRPAERGVEAREGVA